MPRSHGATALAIAVVLHASLVLANGRPPETNGIVLAPGQPHSLYVRTTFGLLVSHDDGCTFDWICDASFNVGGTYDPLFAVTQDGAVVVTSFTGLSVSRDGGCSFQSVPGGTAGRWVDSLALGPTGELWAATSDTVGPGGIYASTDDGATFTLRGNAPPSVEWHGVVVAPGDARRVYASGIEPGMAGSDAGMPARPHFIYSDDGGTTWMESALAGLQYAAYPSLHVAAVDPANADTVFLVSQAANPPSGDLLYRSTDGGVTWTMVLATTDPIHDQISITGPQVLVPTQRGGVYRSGDRGATFAMLSGAPQLECLGTRADGVLFGCGANWDPDFMAVTTSADGGATWQKIWRFVQLHGPLACPTGTIQHDTCEATQWDVLRQQFGAMGPSCGSEVWPSDPPPMPTHSGGCCDAGSAPGGTAALAVLLVVGLRLRRRRQCRSSM